MKSYIIITVQPMNNTGYDVLAGMFLHAGKTLCKIQLSGNSLSYFHRRLCIMKDHAAFFMGVIHFHSINPAAVAQLSAALREEDCLIQYHRIAIFLSFGRQPLFIPVAVLVI